MAVSAAEFWSGFAVQCLAGRGMRSYPSSFLEGSGILEKLRQFFFLFDKEDEDSGPQIKQSAGNSSEVITLFYYLFIGRYFA